MSARRVIIQDPAGQIVHPEATRAAMRGQYLSTEGELAGDLASIDMSDIPNANATARFTVVVQEQCSLGHWHSVTAPIELPNWDDDHWKKL